MSTRVYTFDRVVRLIFSTICAGIIIWLIYYLRTVLLPFGVAAVIAYMLEPMVQFNRRLLHLKGRIVAVLVTLFGMIFLISVMLYLFLPSILEELHQVGLMASAYASSDAVKEMLPPSLHAFLMDQIDLSQLGSWLADSDWQLIGSYAMALVSSSVNFMLSLFNWLLTLLYVLFIMIDYEKLGHGAKAMVPHRYRRKVFGIARDVKLSMNHYFRGQALVAFCVGVLFSIGFLIVGLPMAILFGLFIGVLNLVPYLQLVSLPIAALICMVYSFQTGESFWILAGQVTAVYIIVQSIQDLLLTPKIMGHVMGLNPAIILLSLSVWGSLMGLLGMIIALPMTTLLISYYERYLKSRRKS